jgi:hypothetical protein
MLKRGDAYACNVAIGVLTANQPWSSKSTIRHTAAEVQFGTCLRDCAGAIAKVQIDVS